MFGGTSKAPSPTEIVGLAERRRRRPLRRLWDWRDVEGVDPYGSVGGILKLVLVNYSLHGLRSPHPSEIAEGIFLTPFPLNGKAQFGGNSLAVC